MRLHQMIQMMRAWRDAGKPVPLWAWAQLAREALDDGHRDAIRACVLDRGADPLMRAGFLRELRGPTDATLREAARELLAMEPAWIVFAVLEAIRASPDAGLADAIVPLLDDPRVVADLWWEERLANVAALALRATGDAPALGPWLEARRRELRAHRGSARVHAVTVLARFGDPEAIAAARADLDPEDPFDLLRELLDEIDATAGSRLPR